MRRSSFQPSTPSRVTRDTLLGLNGLPCQSTQPHRQDQPARASLVEGLAQARVTRDSQSTPPDESITPGGSPSDGRLLVPSGMGTVTVKPQDRGHPVTRRS